MEEPIAEDAVQDDIEFVREQTPRKSHKKGKKSQVKGRDRQEYNYGHLRALQSREIKRG
jgi:hypothetical protein